MKKNLYRFIFKKIMGRARGLGLFDFDDKATLWFHAASVGELEILLPLIESEKLKSIPKVVTVFSKSAESQIRKLQNQKEFSLKHASLSPGEGEWEQSLKTVSPKLMITAKYEAWPDFWMSAQKKDIPILIVCAQARSSLTWAKRILRILGEQEPKLYFSVSRPDLIEGLSQAFPESQIGFSGDPRWERIAKRAQNGSGRAKEIAHHYKDSPRPWGVLGSAWPEDLRTLGQGLKDFKGTLFVFPHKINSDFISQIQNELLILDLNVKPVLIAEMGVLLEFYAFVDWAYVGGGFSEGVHSTMEPTFFAVPCAHGPKNQEKFPEIAELSKRKLAHLLSNDTDFTFFIQNASRLRNEEKAQWEEFIKTKQGATAVLETQILSILNGGGHDRV